MLAHVDQAPLFLQRPPQVPHPRHFVSCSYAIDPETEWIVQRTSNVSSTQDYYFFGHG